MIITGSTIYNHFSHPCLYRIHLDLFGDKGERSTPSATGRYLMERGNRHESRVFSDLRARHPDDCIEISADPTLGHEEDIQRRIVATEEAMRQGVRYIMHGFLTSEEGEFLAFEPGVGPEESKFCFRGETDLLERRDDLASDLGDYAYVVGDVKSSRHAKFGQKMQVAFYSALLEKRQGLFPPIGYIVTGDSQQEEFSTMDLMFTLRMFLEEELSECLDEDGVMFHFGPRCRFCHWRKHCGKKAENKDDLSLIPGCKPAEKRTLVAAGILDRKDLLAQSEADLRQLGRRYGNRLDGFRDLKQKAGAQEFGRAIVKQDPRTTTIGHAASRMGAPCLFRHRGPVLMVDAIPDRFYGDEALLAFALVRPLDSDGDMGTFTFVSAKNPGDCATTLRSLFVELNNNNKLLHSTRERALLVFVDASLPYRLRRQAAALWQQHGNAPTSVERLLAESVTLTTTIERTYHLPIDSFDLEKLRDTLCKDTAPKDKIDSLNEEDLLRFAQFQGLADTSIVQDGLTKVRDVFREYDIPFSDSETEGLHDLEGIFVREWRESKDAAFEFLMQSQLAKRLHAAHQVLRQVARLTR